MKRLILAALVVLSACNGPDAVSTPTPQSALERTARAALSCPTGTLVWSTDGGTIDQSGNFAAPPCAPPYADATYNVTVSGCGRTTTIPVTVADEPKALVIYCGVVAPATCCKVPPLMTVPGGTIQFYAGLQYNCAGHVTYSATPPALCP